MSLSFGITKNQLIQTIIDFGKNIMCDEKQNSQLFNLFQRVVFSCHILLHTTIYSTNLLCENDAIYNQFQSCFIRLSVDEHMSWWSLSSV